jgi:lauroyl/myristoyl acyltransferase
VTTEIPKPETKNLPELSRWKRFRYRLEEAGCLLLERWLPLLPRMACVNLGIVVGDLAYFLDRRGRAVALANLDCAFGEEYTPAQKRRIARLSYRNFTRTMLDLFWMAGLTEGTYRNYVRQEGWDAVRDQQVREGRGMIFMCIHQGNWEMASATAGFHYFRNVVVTESFKNPLLTPIFARRREAFGQTMIPQENALIRMLKIVKRAGSTGILIDLNLQPTQAATVIEAFGLKMCVPVLHAVLAQRANTMLVPVETEPNADGTMRATLHPALIIPPEATLQEIAQQCWDYFEPLLRRHPELWLWPYKHFRYRPKDAARPYPFYARESSKFEKLQRTLREAGERV